jgi:hypothetical protein
MPHLAEHLAFLYDTSVFDLSSEAAGMDVSGLIDTKDPDVVKKFDELMLSASNRALDQLSQDQNLLQLMQVIQGGVEYLKTLQQPPPMDPTQVAAQEVQRKTAADQQATQAAAQKTQMDQQRLGIEQQRLALEMSREQREAQAAAAQGANGSAESVAKQQGDAQRVQLDRAKAEAAFKADQAAAYAAEQDRASKERLAAQQRQTELEKARLASDTQLAINEADNSTAMALMQAEIISGEKTGLSNGGGINPSPREQ